MVVPFVNTLMSSKENDHVQRKCQCLQKMPMSEDYISILFSAASLWSPPCRSSFLSSLFMSVAVTDVIKSCVITGTNTNCSCEAIRSVCHNHDNGRDGVGLQRKKNCILIVVWIHTFVGTCLWLVTDLHVYHACSLEHMKELPLMTILHVGMLEDHKHHRIF